MKKRSILKIAFIVSLTLATSCTKDFLDKEPISEVVPEQYFTEEAQLGAYAIDLYGVLPSHGNWSFGTFGIDTDTDNMADLSYDNKYVPGQWRVPQNGGSWDFYSIYRCNYFFEKVLPKLENNEISGSEAMINQYIGEMYFLRAYIYFTKVQAFGDFPIIEDVLPDDLAVLTEASKRSPHPDVVRFIISDLDKAIDMMMPNSPDGGKNRLSRDCALLLKSRVALYEGTWLKYFKNTAFVPNGPDWPGAQKDYNQGYMYPAGDIDSEINWLLDQAMDAAQEVADAHTLTVNNGVLQQSPTDTANPYFDMFSDTDMSGYDEVLLWRDYDRALGVTHNVPVYAMLGNDGVGLTKGIVNSFLMSNGLPIYASGSGYQGDDYISDVRTNRDGRLWLFLKEPGQLNVLYEASEGDHATLVEPVPNITSGNVEQAYSTGYTIRKGLSYDQAQAVNGGGYTGAIVFRAVEAYLNYIEASYEKEGAINGTAAQYWQAIRQRAMVDTDYQSTITHTDMSIEAQGDWGAYSAGSLISPTLYNIRRERRSELMAEGLRNMDLKRWRAMDQMISNPYHIEGFKLWGPMQNWYDNLTYGTNSSNVSAPSISEYLRPYEKTGNELVYNGYKWHMAHYWEPVAIQHFLITSQGNDVQTSPIYQNPYWPTTANEGPQ